MAGLILLIIAYLLGSLSSALLLAKLSGAPDPRESGSGNPGATNVLRTQGKSAAIKVLVGDIVKGFVAVLLAHMAGFTGLILGLTAFAAVLGHVFPLYFKFKGGKGVATSLGALLALSPTTAIVCLIVWLVITMVTKYVSLASIIGVVLAAVVVLFTQPGTFLGVLLMALLILWRHQDNIKRLKAGEENKTDLFSKAA